MMQRLLYNLIGHRYRFVRISLKRTFVFRCCRGWETWATLTGRIFLVDAFIKDELPDGSWRIPMGVIGVEKPAQFLDERSSATVSQNA